MPVGLIEEAEYEEVEIPFGPGDRLFLYSDGVTECGDPEGELFTDGRLEELLHRGGALPLDELLKRAVERLKEWCATDDFEDDVTIIGIEREQDES